MKNSLIRKFPGGKLTATKGSAVGSRKTATKVKAKPVVPLGFPLELPFELK